MSRNWNSLSIGIAGLIACLVACGPRSSDQSSQGQVDSLVQDSLDQVALIEFEKRKAEVDADLLAKDLVEVVPDIRAEDLIKEDTVVSDTGEAAPEEMAMMPQEIIPDPPLESVSYETAPVDVESDNVEVVAEVEELQPGDVDEDGIPDYFDEDPYETTESGEVSEPISRGITEESLESTEAVPAQDNTAQASGINSEDFKVKLAVDSNLKLGQTGTLRVWIGAAALEKAFNPRLARAETTFPANVGQFAKITPYAPDFDISESEVTCVKIDRSGAEVKYSITAKKTGKLNVSATVHLFNGDNCDGIPTPKSVETISVEVKVDGKEIVTGKLGEMFTVFWDSFMSFWGALVALVFAALLYVIRKKMKSKTGYEDPGAS